MPDPLPVIKVSEPTKRYGPPDLGLLVIDHISYQVHQEMETIVITFERRIGALEWLLLAPLRLLALLAGRLLGGKVLGLVTTLVVLIVALAVFGASGVNWPLLIPGLILPAAALSALGVLVSVSVRKVLEAQTLANTFRFSMMFLERAEKPIAAAPFITRV
jgi:ABC-2 type transport system permease protein